MERLSGASNRLSVGYKGDTFTQPFRSYENPTLVRLLCKLSVNIGENVSITFRPSIFPFSFSVFMENGQNSRN